MAIWRIPRILDETGKKSRGGFYAEVAAGLMPRPVNIGPRAVGLPEDEVQAVVKARIAGWTDDQVRALVQRLHIERQARAPSL